MPARIFHTIVAISIAMTALLAGQAAATPVTFSFPAPASVQNVSVAGSFNDWSTSATPLTNRNGVWEATIDFAPGSYQYKIVVNGTQWLTDESAKSFADDGFGGKNSVLEVGAEAMTVGGGAMAGAAVKAPAGGGAAVPAPASGMTRVTFRYQPPPGARTVSVAGSFNNWTVDATPLQDPTGGGIWEAVLDLAPGSYQYKFVIDGSTWKTDEAATEFIDDGFGGKNSVLNVAGSTMTVGSKAGAAPKPVKDGGPTPAAGATTSVTFRYQPVIGGVNSASVAGSFNGWDATRNPMSDPDKDGVWEATVLLPVGKAEYKFVVNGDQWFADDFAPDSASDGLGGQNSVVMVGANPMILGPGGNVAAKGNAPPAGLRQVTFRFKPAGKPASVMLAGTFNDWNVGKTPLSGPDNTGEYSATLLLQEGEYQYKFVADGNWTTDTAHADSYVDDGFGGKNSVVRVDSRFPAVEVKLGDGKISDAGIEHSQSSTEVNNMGGGHVEITFRSHRGDIECMDLLLRE
jgi:1,4-alpha-glucan branching enzyme